MVRQKNNQTPLAVATMPQRSLCVSTLVLRATVALLAATTALSCGRRESLHGVPDGAYGVPDFLTSPPGFSPVAVGSRDVVASPDPVPQRGTVIVTLASEPGAVVSYSLQNFAADADPASLTTSTGPMTFIPPVTIWAQAAKDDLRGPVRSFFYGVDPDFLPALAALPAQRLVRQTGTYAPFVSGTAAQQFAGLTGSDATDTTPFGTGMLVIDGKPNDWSGQGRLFVRDGLGDVPANRPAIDLVWAQVAETNDHIALVASAKERPVAGEGYSYGFDIGLSNIAFSSFGAGTTFIYRVEVAAGVFKITEKETGAPVTISAGSRGVLDEAAEFSIVKADLPLLKGKTELVIRVYASQNKGGTTTQDRFEPLFLRSLFAMDRISVGGQAPGRSWEVDFLADGSLKRPELAADYLDLASTLLPELERSNQMRIQTTGSLPVFYVANEVNGYSGLNTSDRGLLTTIGPLAGSLAKAQILAHELAHYQNARNSQLKPRWLQEGMSEWTAERLLYLHYPARAVHRFMRKLRFDRYFDSQASAKDNFPLDKWGTESQTIGYEKSLMFMDLLEARVGQDALVQGFQQAVNEPMDSAGWQRFLEKRSGKDLSGLFRFWVHPGDPEPENDPFLLYKDDDGDELLTLDEQVLGTNPALGDTDGDGYFDGEEYFLGRDPLVSGLGTKVPASPTTPVLVAAAEDDTDTNALFRLGGVAGSRHKFALQPFQAAPEQFYVSPLLLRPPYAAAVQSVAGGVSGTMTVLRRPLYVRGQQLVTGWQDDTQLVLPETKRTMTDFLSVPDIGPGFGRGGTDMAFTDASDDMPGSLASYDLKAVAVAETATTLSLQLTTTGKPDRLGSLGDYVVTFDGTLWTSDGPVSTRYHALTIADGAPYLHTYNDDGSVKSSELLHSGITLTYGDSGIDVVIDKTRVAPWAAADGDRTVCPFTQVFPVDDFKIKDRASCVTMTNPGYTRYSGAHADYFQRGTHQLELFVKATTTDAARGSKLVSLGLSALNAFEEVLQRPLFERNHWPVHLVLQPGASGYVDGAASTRSGSYLSVPGFYETAPAGKVGYRLDVLFVEQLARLVMADLLEKSPTAPAYWLQETFIQWLTAAAMYRIYPSSLVHDFHSIRLEQYWCFLSAAISCPASNYDADVPLADWDFASLGSTGSVKSLTFALELDAALSSKVMAQVFSSYANALPDAAGFKALLLNYAPAAEAARIEGFWQTWVTGSGNGAADETAIEATLANDDDDDLYFFEDIKFNDPTTAASVKYVY